MGDELIITPTLSNHLEETVEEIKCRLLLKLACLYKCQPCSSNLTTLLTAKSAKALPQVGK